MEVRTAKSAGFCFGVKRAVDKAYELAEHKEKAIYTLGPIIHNEEDIRKLLQNFSLIGGGGTDFRPAFADVDQLLSEGAFHHLKGLLYFTDGKGIYPAKRPPYETAFVFIGDNEEQQVPPWAMKINLNQEDF